MRYSFDGGDDDDADNIREAAIYVRQPHQERSRHNRYEASSDYGLPYLWQVKMSGEWYTVNDSESVEQKFCIPGEILHYCSVTVAGENLICRVAFGDKITTTLMGYQTVQYRRLTNRSFKEAGDVADVDRYITQWIWYWQDNDGRWEMFEPDSLQHTLEAKFLAKQPTYLYSRENYTWEYVIDFESMTQQNLTTGTNREIRRRPLFVSYRDVQRNFTPQRLSPPQVIDVGLPPSWVPWDVAHPFELVQLSYTDTEFIKVSNNFYTTMSRQQLILKAVFRVQNHALWTAFCNHEKTMLNNQRRLGDRNPVDKRDLFHGTDSLDTVRGICINNFDFRLCGKNATKYGKGAYFARDAEYSHCYTKPSGKLERYMFQAKVLVGYYATGSEEYKRPPEKPGKDHELFDSCVDNDIDPSIFILFEKTAYYPEYVIKYKYTEDTDESTPQPVMSILATQSYSSVPSLAVQQAQPPTATASSLLPYHLQVLNQMNVTRNRDVPSAVTSSVRRRPVHASRSVSTYAPLPTAPTSSPPQQIYVSPQPFTYAGISSSTGKFPPAQPTRIERSPSSPVTSSGATSTRPSHNQLRSRIPSKTAQTSPSIHRSFQEVLLDCFLKLLLMIIGIWQTICDMVLAAIDYIGSLT